MSDAALEPGDKEACEEETPTPVTTPERGGARSSRISFEKEEEPTQARLLRLVKRSLMSARKTIEGLAWMMLRAL